MTAPKSAPRGEHTPRAGSRWETELRWTGEQLIDDQAPEPTPNRAARRAAKRVQIKRSQA
ncbi:hypothetical protein [Streptomyces sp. NRRL B-24720]|uniref:hypothetical protein n=1 Tax=Streptomyces sp. NRRL B-24720 TaxID=1476876 RepID=UPI0004C54885|nr:hypothetical protein [Streptomyces sp. NRRL B-24720]